MDEDCHVAVRRCAGGYLSVEFGPGKPHGTARATLRGLVGSQSSCCGGASFPGQQSYRYFHSKQEVSVSQEASKRLALLRVSWGGYSGWQTLAVRNTPLSEAAFGDFDGDGAADVFRARCL